MNDATDNPVKSPSRPKPRFKGRNTPDFLRQEQNEKREREVTHAEQAIHRPTTKEVALSNIKQSEEYNRLVLTYEDVVNGVIAPEDPNVKVKTEELNDIINMAHTLEATDIIYTPFAFALPGGRCELIDGHRRNLSKVYKAIHLRANPVEDPHQVLQEETMELRVFPTKPPEEKMLAIAAITGAHAKETPLTKRLEWAARRNAIERETTGNSLGSDFYQHEFNLKTSQAAKYKKIIELPTDELPKLIEALDSGAIKNLNQAHEIASIDLKRKRQKRLSDLKTKKTVSRSKSTKVSLGATDNLAAVHDLIETGASKSFFKELDEQTNWESVKDTQSAFRKFLKWWTDQYE
jgi:hypothetical protein